MPKKVRVSVDRKRYPRPLLVQPQMVYHKLSAWNDYDKLPPLLPQQRVLLGAFMSLCKYGRLPSVTQVRDISRLSKAISIRVWTDLHLAGYAQLIDSVTSSAINIAIHPLAWAALKVEKPVASVLPKTARDLTQKQLHPTGRVVYRVCINWFEAFCYWPAPADIAAPLGLTREGARQWLTKLTHMKLIDHQSHLIFNEPSTRNIETE